MILCIFTYRMSMEGGIKCPQIQDIARCNQGSRSFRDEGDIDIKVPV